MDRPPCPWTFSYFCHAPRGACGLKRLGDDDSETVGGEAHIPLDGFKLIITGNSGSLPIGLTDK